MFDFNKLFDDFKECDCGCKHECTIKDIVIENNVIPKVGEILKRNDFPKKLLLVADKTTIKVADGIIESLKDFELTTYIYDYLRVSTMKDVNMVEKYIDNGIEAVIGVGTGSIHDTCRLASARKNVPLCLFATAPSMDGFASDSAPIVDNNFKITYHAKSPSVIITDPSILAKSPVELKRAGYGDMVAKYVAIIDWKVSNLISGESYCDKVQELTRFATDRVFLMSKKVELEDEEAATKIFEGLLMTGIAMSFTKTSRPGSGCEHILAHYIECVQLLDGIIPDFHGEDVGVTTLIILKFYNELLKYDSVKAFKEENNWNDIKKAYGPLYSDVLKLNTPDTITDTIDPKLIENNFDKIKEIIKSVPSYEEVLKGMNEAGCKITYKDINKSYELINNGFIYHPYMRRRLSLRRLINMTNLKYLIEEFIEK